MDSKALIKEMQRVTVNLCNYEESRVLGITNDATSTSQNNGFGELLSQKSIIDILKALE